MSLCQRSHTGTETPRKRIGQNRGQSQYGEGGRRVLLALSNNTTREVWGGLAGSVSGA